MFTTNGATLIDLHALVDARALVGPRALVDVHTLVDVRALGDVRALVSTFIVFRFCICGRHECKCNSDSSRKRQSFVDHFSRRKIWRQLGQTIASGSSLAPHF
jgi:hypothetical protein